MRRAPSASPMWERTSGWGMNTSMMLTPASIAVRITASVVAKSASVTCSPPKPMRLTRSPVFPRSRYSILFSPLRFFASVPSVYAKFPVV